MSADFKNIKISDVAQAWGIRRLAVFGSCAKGTAREDSDIDLLVEFPVKNKYLRHARISEHEFRSILELFCADVEALKASRITGVNKNTTHRIYGLLRKRVVELAHAEAAPFAGCVEVDESYFGPRRVRGIRGRGAARKVPVIGLLKRGGRVIYSPLPNCSKSELLQMIKGHVSPASESTIFTDGWRGYDGLVLEGYKHYRVHHG